MPCRTTSPIASWPRSPTRAASSRDRWCRRSAECRSRRRPRGQLVLRCWGMESHPTPAEHAELRAALEAFVAAHPDDADIWAELSHLYSAEYWLGFNALPDPRRARTAGRAARDRARTRAISKAGSGSRWPRSCLHDEHELAEAAERAIALNPRNANTLARIGLRADVYGRIRSRRRAHRAGDGAQPVASRLVSLRALQPPHSRAASSPKR